MALITISGQPGSRHEEAARLTAHRLRFELVTAARLESLIGQEFGERAAIPDKAFPDVLTSILARLATEHHLVVNVAGAELLFRNVSWVLRASIVAPESRRIGTLMLEHRLDRAAAKQMLRDLDAAGRADRKKKFGAATAAPHCFDIVFNSAAFEAEQVSELVEAVAHARALREQGLLSAAAEAHLQFQARLELSKHGLTPPGRVSLKRAAFVHPSEEIFANLLDFYRVAWEYEPRSFPVKWDTDGKVLEAFTPDFYLPEFDLYVELTTMKQSLVTRKNRKVKLLREIYPKINIQVFYQKDVENLIFKYGLSERLAKT
jgi:hypothetical protein